ncbi:aldehyde dehydrogenase family protein [Propioniciclava coleopterorum]|uniref:aldehyde dehydrogenase family protein n=1 Tax=Propioniciclava coleopterorum TaxID=2714937 RepID=UPI001FE835D9|nr:aldehyde dehydrogenase family protein [Propioniciclava coleopterorum]
MKSTAEYADQARAALLALGVEASELEPGTGPRVAARTPLTGGTLFEVPGADADGVRAAVGEAAEAFAMWRDTPAPVRGRLVRRLGDLIAEHRDDLATLVTIEAGKIRTEALGEVQEMSDICDFAVGLSRQLYGRTMPSERAGHRLQETWQPLGVVGVISAFNFPVAVWSWNTAIALACGDTVVWKPSELTSLCALGCAALLRRAAREVGAPDGVHRLVLGARDTGQALVDDPRVALVSATGSTRMGREVGPRVAARFGRSLLELGGNNAVVVTATANLDQAVASVVFGAAGTAGQRCTSTRRLLVHDDVADEVIARVGAAFERLPIGDPFAEGTLVGPLIGQGAWEAMADAIAAAQAQGGRLVAGGDRVRPGREDDDGEGSPLAPTPAPAEGAARGGGEAAPARAEGAEWVAGEDVHAPAEVAPTTEAVPTPEAVPAAAVPAPAARLGAAAHGAAGEGRDLGVRAERPVAEPEGYWVRPALLEMPTQAGVMLKETFAPVLYAVRYRDLDEAIALHNAVPQGLSGGIFTADMIEAERYLALADTGIANVNAGTSGAEIGGAFGGEKETGGGRESGSDAWRAYMRRSTNAINYSGGVELAQGVDFG